MIKYFLFVAIALVSLSAEAQQAGLYVNGYGVVRVEPDIAMFSFGIQGQTDTPADAMQRADSISGDLVRRLEGIGIDSDDIRSTPVALNPFIDRQTQRELIRFSRTTTAVLRDLDDFEAVYEASLASGINSIGNVTFTASNIDELQNQARDLALEDAQAQAEAIAAKLGIQVGRVLSVNTSRPQPPGIFRGREMAMVSADVAPEFRTGLIEVNQDASVNFEIVQP